MILICFDGSPDAQAAIDQAGKLMPGRDATVLVLWETILETMSRNGSLGMGFGMTGADDDGAADVAIQEAALNTAAEGVERANGAGLRAVPRTENQCGDIATEILRVAADIDAEAVVLGTRGRGDVKSLMLGSVSHAILHHADRPVLVVPSPSLVERRGRWANHADRGAGVV